MSMCYVILNSKDLPPPGTPSCPAPLHLSAPPSTLFSMGLDSHNCPQCPSAWSLCPDAVCPWSLSLAMWQDCPWGTQQGQEKGWPQVCLAPGFGMPLWNQLPQDLPWPLETPSGGLSPLAISSHLLGAPFSPHGPLMWAVFLMSPFQFLGILELIYPPGPALGQPLFPPLLRCSCPCSSPNLAFQNTMS